MFSRDSYERHGMALDCWYSVTDYLSYLSLMLTTKS